MLAMNSNAGKRSERPLRNGQDRAKVYREQVQIEHVSIVSARSYEDVKGPLDQLPRFDDNIRVLLRFGEVKRALSELNRIQGNVGLTVFSRATHGDWLQIISGTRKAIQYVIGNILISTQMTKEDLRAGLYAPLRIMLFENEAGTATLEYDLPSTLFGQFGNQRITAVAKALDQKIYDVLMRAAA
jgi:uncharacterized protein (DUF302 family)